MRQNAVSSAPQNEDANHTAAMIASMPAVVDVCCSRWIAVLSVLSAALGNSCWRSSSTELCSFSERSTRPAIHSATSASGKIDSSRL